MRLETVRKALRRQVSSTETTRRLHEARARQPDLRPFGDAAALVAFLHDTDPRGTHARSAVTRALLAETQGRKHACWTAILMVAYFPGLLRIRLSLGATAWFDRDDLDWLVVESFLEVAGSLPLDTQGRLAVVNLVLGTRKAVFQQLRAAAERAAAERPLPENVDSIIRGQAPSPERILMRREAEAALTPARVRGWFADLCQGESAKDVLLVLGSYASGKPLIDYVREQHPSAGREEFLRTYGCFRRRRSRLLARLRAKLRREPLSQHTLVAALLHQEVRR